MVKDEILYLSQADVVEVGVTMAETIALLETAFGEKGQGQVEMPPKPGIHPGDGDNFIHAMPAYIPGMNSAGIKWVSGFPDNARHGLPYITGLLILNDPETGLPLAVMDCVWITGVRTAAASAVAAKHLARKDSAVLGILGCGVQGRTHVEAMNVIFPLTKILAYDLNRDAAESFAAEVSHRYELPVEIVADPRAAVAPADLIVTAGPILKEPHQTIRSGWMKPGAFASLVDFDSYWHPSAMQEADKFCTDDIDQLRHYQEVGYFSQIPPVYSDLGDLVTGKNGGRESASERTMTANLGLAMDDMAVAPAIFSKAVEMRIGRWLPR